MFHGKPRGENGLPSENTFEWWKFHENPRRKKCFTKTPKGKNGLPSENTNNHDHTHETRYNEQGRIFVVWVLNFSSRFIPQLFVFEFFIFCGVREKGKKPFCIEGKFWFPSFCCEGKFWFPSVGSEGKFWFPWR